MGFRFSRAQFSYMLMVSVFLPVTIMVSNLEVIKNNIETLEKIKIVMYATSSLLMVLSLFFDKFIDGTLSSAMGMFPFVIPAVTILFLWSRED